MSLAKALLGQQQQTRRRGKAGSKFIDIAMLGDQKIARRLRTLELKLQRKIVTQATRAGTKLIAAAAQANALAIARRPIEEGVMRKVASYLRPGRVRAIARSRKASLKEAAAGNLAVGARVSIRGRRGLIGHQISTPTRSELGISPASKWYPPAHIELGTQHRPALSYMRKAFLETEYKARSRIRRLIWAGILKVARRG